MKILSHSFALSALGAVLLPAGLVRAEPGIQFPPVPADALQKMKDAAPDKAPAKPIKPRKLLVFYRTQGYVHQSIPYGIEALKILGQKTGAFTVVASDDMAMFTPQKLAEFDGVLFLSTTGLTFEDPATRKALLDFLASGKGIMGIHAATDNFPSWPEAREIMGGKFHGHPWGGGDTEAVKVDDPKNPINLAFGGKGFWIKDEIYQIDEAYSRDKQRVLLSLDMSKPQNDRSATGQIVRTDNDFPIAWIKKLPGGGRVYYCSLGHNNEIFETPEILRHYLAGIQFALGDLKVDATPSAKLSPQPVAATAGEISVLQEKIRIESLDGWLAKFATYDFGQSRESISAISFLTRNADSEGRAKIETALLALLAKPGLSYAAKDQICRWLVLVGTDKSVAPLAALLTDEKIGTMAVYALFELRLPSAMKALHQGLSGAAPFLKPSIIGSLGRLGDAASIPAFATISASQTVDDARAAIIALGAIGTPESLTALGKAKVAPALQTVKGWALLDGASRITRDTPKDTDFAV
ncbi:MAG TPA: ThuA domain-containing protein, partial [Chthoniobacterales bacterium]|nr:ThuA domain-containing protein [Chthoniobacterales bacterium]